MDRLGEGAMDRKRAMDRLSGETSRSPKRRKLPVDLHMAPPADFAAAAAAAGGRTYEASAPWLPLVEEHKEGEAAAAAPPPPPDDSDSETEYSIPAGCRREDSVSPEVPKPAIKVRKRNPSDDYEFVSKAGSGGFGTVNFVKDKRHHDREVALKKIMDVDTKAKNKMAIREVVIMSRMKDINICNLLDAYRYKDTQVGILMEACHGDLHHYIRETLVNLKRNDKISQIKHIALGILNGVLFMHCENVLHRDLKPQNILMKRGGGIKITDFGLSRKISNERFTERKRNYSKGMGTFTYSCPEILLLESDYGFETDMWSIACIIGEMFSGNYPFPLRYSEYTTGDQRTLQLNAIQHLCGDIKLPLMGYRRPDLTRGNRKQIIAYYSAYTDDRDALKILDGAFELDPEKRPTVFDMIMYPYWEEDPGPKASMPFPPEKDVIPL